MLEYQGPSSNLELLGYIQKTELIYELIEKILHATRHSALKDSAVMALLETMEIFVAKFHRIIQKLVKCLCKSQMINWKALTVIYHYKLQVSSDIKFYWRTAQ